MQMTYSRSCYSVESSKVTVNNSSICRKKSCENTPCYRVTHNLLYHKWSRIHTYIHTYINIAIEGWKEVASHNVPKHISYLATVSTLLLQKEKLSRLSVMLLPQWYGQWLFFKGSRASNQVLASKIGQDQAFSGWCGHKQLDGDIAATQL